MSTPRNQWLLKVVAGPNQGAEVGVRVGKLLIGSDDECDVILRDVLVAPQHAEIDATANGIAVAPLGGRVYINGKRVREARQLVPDYAFVSLGGTHLIIGPEDGKWPLLSAADAPELERETEAPAAEAPKAETPEPVKSEAVVKAAPQSSPAVQTHTRTRAIFGIVTGVLLLLVWFVAYLKYTGDSKDEPEKEVASSKPVDRARAVVASMDLGDSIKIEQTAGRVSVSGYVDTEAKQRELQAAFRQALPGLNTRIYSLEKIASSARSLLDNEPLPLTVTSLSEGKLKITGKLASAEPWVRMRQTLRRSVPGLSGIEDGVEIETPRIAGQAQPRTIVVQAPTFNPARLSIPAAEPTAAIPTQTLPPVGEMEAGDPEYLITPDTVDTMQATVANIRVPSDSLSFVRLSSGGVYFEGARFPYGGKIISIEANTVTIDEKGSTRILQQGDTVVKQKNAPLPGLSSTAKP